jgi:integrase
MMRRQDIANGELHVVQQKTGVELSLPIKPELELAVKAYPAKALALIGNEHGAAYTRPGLSKFMRQAIAAAGLLGRCNSHGLRKALMRRLAEAGKSEKQIASCIRP